MNLDAAWKMINTRGAADSHTITKVIMYTVLFDIMRFIVLAR